MAQPRNLIPLLRSARWANAICPSCRASLLLPYSTTRPYSEPGRRGSSWNKAPATRERETIIPGGTASKKDQREARLRALKVGFDRFWPNLSKQLNWSTSAENAFEFVKRMQTCNSYQQFNQWLQELNVELRDIAIVSRLLLLNKEGSFNEVAKKISLFASEAGNLEATLLVLAYGYETDSLQREVFKAPMKRLGERVDSDKSCLEALILHALILIRKGEAWRGRELLETVTHSMPVIKPPTESLNDPLARLDPARAWRELGIVQLHTGNPDGAILAFRKAALEFDDPLAYACLATNEETNGHKYSMDWLTYTIKAASGGHPDSAYSLALMYSMSDDQIREQVKDTSVRREILNTSRSQSRLSAYRNGKPWRRTVDENRYSWAIDWLGVGLNHSHKPSTWENAQLYWKLSKLSGLLDDIKTAVKSLLWIGALPRQNPGMKEQLAKQLQEWTGTDVGRRALKEIQEAGEAPVPRGLNVE